MTQSYQKECLYCKQMITMSDESGKWLPYNKDKSAHDCRTNGQNKKISNKSLLNKQEFTLDEVRKKLESIGIIIELGQVD